MGLPFVDAEGSGDLATAQRGRFVQVEVGLSGPGWDTPRIRDLRIVGRRCRRCAEVDPTSCPETRTSDGLVALWRFDEGGGNVVRDVSGFLVHDLIAPTNATFTWEADHVNVETGRFTVDRPIDALVDAFTTSNAFTVEAWVRAANDTQGGPARVLTISDDPTSRSLTLGQEASQWEGRVRRDGVTNGDPYVFSADGSASTTLRHVVLTRTASGEQRFWVDGTPSGDPVDAPEPIDEWDYRHRLYVANEETDDRQWAGEIHLIALYDRALSADEIARHQRVGP